MFDTRVSFTVPKVVLVPTPPYRANIKLKLSDQRKALSTSSECKRLIFISKSLSFAKKLIFRGAVWSLLCAHCEREKEHS
jgi:hypothetical protein